MTKFGAYLAFWQNLKRVRQFFGGVFNISQNSESTLANLVCYYANFRSFNGQILKNKQAIRSHWCPSIFPLQMTFLNEGDVYSTFCRLNSIRLGAQDNFQIEDDEDDDGQLMNLYLGTINDTLRTNVVSSVTR